MTADELAKALTDGASGWLVLSIAAILPMLWSFAMIMHFARPYVIRFLQSLTLRFGGDVWWLSYVLIRDALLTIVLAMGVIMLMPDLYIGLGLPLTAPLAVVVLLWAMLVKLFRDADDDPNAFRLTSILLVIASVLYIVPQIYGLEAADQVEWLDQYGLGWIPGALSATSGDPPVVNALAWPILDLSLVLFGLTAALVFIRFVVGLGRSEAPATDTGA
jgi:hypothetical protein